MPENRLAREKSPYLLQHAHNPVDWYPWGEEALARAREEDKPIFLSVGYSTCHWCHVMERESFEDEAVAALMNEHYVCIKVDREERPDVDEIYMAAVQAMTGQGGWPLSAWLTPQLEPFYGGTYFPPDDRFGRPGFPRVLSALAEAWTNERDKVFAQAAQLRQALEGLGGIRGERGTLDRSLVDAAYEQLAGSYDARWGGWGGAPKFPRTDFGALALRHFARTGDQQALTMVERTLESMARGGMFDHLAGGFARYSTDDRWLVPHFEKMLYDNAQLAFHYLEAHQLTGREDFAEVARRTLDYVLATMTDPEGGFHSAEDADSEGVEGKFYVWSLEEIGRVLDGVERDLFVRMYGVSAAGNWEGSNVLERVATVEELASSDGLSEPEVRAHLESARSRLLAAREKRVRPGRDDKVLTAWNGLMIEALARGAVVLDDDRYLEAASRAAGFVLRELRDDEGRLLRRWREGEARIAGYAEDHALLVRGLLELYQAGLDLEWLEHARALHDELFAVFGDPEDGALFNTRPDQDDLIVRTKAGYDGSVPTANSVAAANALKLFELTGERAYADQVEGILRAFEPVLREAPLSMVHLVLVLDAWLGERLELVLAAASRDAARAFLTAARTGYHPDLVVAHVPDGEAAVRARTIAPVLEGRERGEVPVRAWVCRGFHCEQPVTSLEELTARLDLLRRDGKA